MYKTSVRDTGGGAAVVVRRVRGGVERSKGVGVK
jgi:hypothetical protein